MSRNVFKKSFLASLSTMSVIPSSNAEEITLNKEAYNNLGEQNNVANENSLSFIQRHPKLITTLAIAGGAIGGAALKQPVKYLYKGITYPLDRNKENHVALEIYKKIYGEIKPAKFIKQKAGRYWCWLASLEGVLNSLGITNVSQEDLYKMVNVKLEGNIEKDPQNVKLLPRDPAFFEGNRDNLTIGLMDGLRPDSLLSGTYNGNSFESIAQRISPDLHGGKFIIVNQPGFGLKSEGLEFFMKHVSDKMKGWFVINDPINLGGHAKMCKLEGENLYFEDPSGAIAYSMDLKKWCDISIELINEAANERPKIMSTGIFLEAYGLTKEKIKSNTIFLKSDKELRYVEV